MVKREQLPELLSLGHVFFASVTKVQDGYLADLSQVLCGAPVLFLNIFFSFPNFSESRCCIFFRGLDQMLRLLECLPWLSEPSGTPHHHTHTHISPYSCCTNFVSGWRAYASSVSVSWGGGGVISMVSGTPRTHSEQGWMNKMKSNNVTAKVKNKCHHFLLSQNLYFPYFSNSKTTYAPMFASVYSRHMTSFIWVLVSYYVK